jgi:hypothetical protein
MSASIGVAIAVSDANSWPAPEKSKLCTIGAAGSYISKDAECIDTRAKCEKKGGTWRGSVLGRGRSIGCDLPTKDAGNRCADSSQCETICVAHDSSNKNCSCYGRTIVPKGPQPDTCSFDGLKRGAHVD